MSDRLATLYRFHIVGSLVAPLDAQRRHSPKHQAVGCWIGCWSLIRWLLVVGEFAPAPGALTGLCECGSRNPKPPPLLYIYIISICICISAGPPRMWSIPFVPPREFEDEMITVHVGRIPLEVVGRSSRRGLFSTTHMRTLSMPLNGE